MASYRIANEEGVKDEPGFNALLLRAYAAKIRPLCLCNTPPIEMYVAKLDGKFFIKRMPNSGSDHHFTCESFDPPAELSGLGQVQGTAIKEDTEDGTTALRFDFSLTKVPGRKPPEKQETQGASVKTDGNKLTLTSTLHYLWEQAQFNRWEPAMKGKRGWYVIRKYLLQAAQNKSTKGVDLASLLYIPENFQVEKKDEITHRRMAQMIKATNGAKGPRKLMLCIGEVKSIEASRYGFKLVLKHLPDCHFMMNEDMHKRLTKRFGLELGMREAAEDTYLICIGTFSVSETGITTLEEAALMVVNANWIPIESLYEKHLIDAMVASGRRFTKGLRYNVTAERPVACMVVTDTQPSPTAMFVVTPSASETYQAALDDLMADSSFQSWVWHVSDPDMPKLPAQVLEHRIQGKP